MNLSVIILAFLSARCPSAYDTPAIARRVNASGLLDAPAAEDQVEAELKLLSDTRGFAAHTADTMTGQIYWTATKLGVEEWIRRGSLLVQ